MCPGPGGCQHVRMPQHRPDSRFAADVDYTGHTGHHDYVVRARHRLLDTTFTVVIDGVEHDPKAEETARKAREKEEVGQVADRADEDGRDGPADGEDAAEGDTADGGDTAGGNPADGDDLAGGDGSADGEDDLRFTLEDGFTTLRCTVRRPREDGSHKEAEVITIRTAGLGGAGEVEVRHGFRRTVLVPAEGSPSAARDARRTAHPTRYALIAALARSMRYLLPLLGFGALFSGLLDPLEEWVEARVRPLVEAVARAIAPLRDWLAELLQPLWDALAWLLRPVNAVLEWLLSPVRELLAWLLGLLPEFELPFDVPGWVVNVVIAAIVVVSVFAATRRGLQERRKKLTETWTRRDEASEGAGGVPEAESDEAAGDGTGPNAPDASARRGQGVSEAIRSPG